MFHTLLSPFDCFYVGYFLSIVSTTSQERFLVTLHNCIIGDQGCKFFARGFLKGLGTVEVATACFHLYLGVNDIHEGIADIGKILKQSTAIRKLDLTYNPLSYEGLKILFEALSTNTTLEELVLK